jgi:hypothetical protein
MLEDDFSITLPYSASILLPWKMSNGAPHLLVHLLA